MSAKKITIVIDETTLPELRQRVPQGQLSAFVAEAVRHKLRTDAIKELLAQLDSIYGPLTQEENAEGAEWYDQAMQRLSSNDSEQP